MQQAHRRSPVAAVMTATSDAYDTCTRRGDPLADGLCDGRTGVFHEEKNGNAVLVDRPPIEHPQLWRGNSRCHSEEGAGDAGVVTVSGVVVAADAAAGGAASAATKWVTVITGVLLEGSVTVPHTDTS